MREFTYLIQDVNGMHARPAGRLATYAKRFTSDVQVCANGKQADGKRLLALMSLGATRGSVLEFRVSGEDEEQASEALMQFCKENLNGGEA